MTISNIKEKELLKFDINQTKPSPGLSLYSHNKSTLLLYSYKTNKLIAQ